MQNNTPEYILDDPRIGRRVRTYKGLIGVIESVMRDADGYELISVYDAASGYGNGGLAPDQITFLGEE